MVNHHLRVAITSHEAIKTCCCPERSLSSCTSRADSVKLTAEGVNPRSRSVRDMSDRANVFLYIMHTTCQHEQPRLGHSHAPRERKREADRLDVHGQCLARQELCNLAQGCVRSIGVSSSATGRQTRNTRTGIAWERRRVWLSTTGHTDLQPRLGVVLPCGLRCRRCGGGRSGCT